MSDRLKMPPERDFGFYQRRKHDKWREVSPPDPALEATVADSHAHIHMLPDPAWELARCTANGVDVLCMVTDPSEDGPRPFDELNGWMQRAAALCQGLSEAAGADSSKRFGDGSLPQTEECADAPECCDPPSQTVADGKKPDAALVPSVCIAVGVHPHNAKLYDDEIERILLHRLEDPRVAVLGEIGLDYHYDLSPRDVQRRVFRRQIALAKELGAPLALHLRGGEDPAHDNAHAEAYDILAAADALGPSTLLHCCTLGAEELAPWVEADCYIAYGGALTFKSADAVRKAAALVPENRLLLETDSPYMTPEPMRGAACTPAHVIFTAAALAEARGVKPGDSRKSFLEQIHGNTIAFLEGRVAR